jgi:hypothetical protein
MYYASNGRLSNPGMVIFRRMEGILIKWMIILVAASFHPVLLLL